MQVTMDFTTYLKAKQALEFAIDECSNRSEEAHAAGETRTAQSWLFTRADFIKALDEFDRLPVRTSP